MIKKNRNSSAGTRQSLNTTFESSNDPFGEIKDQFVVNQTKSIKGNDGVIHVRELVANIILIIGIGGILGMNFGGVISIPVGAIGGICGAIYVIYLLVGLIFNPYFSQFNNIQKGVQFQSEYNNVRNLNGYFSFYGRSYHYETRYHTRQLRTEYRTKIDHYTTEEEVETHTDYLRIDPSECVDDSGPIQHMLSQKPILFVQSQINYRFSDSASQQKFENQWLSFQKRNRLDAYQSFSKVFVVPGFKDKLCFYFGNNPSSYVRWLVFFSVIGFMWPASMVIQQKIGRFNIQYKKVVTL